MRSPSEIANAAEPVALDGDIDGCPHTDCVGTGDREHSLVDSTSRWDESSVVRCSSPDDDTRRGHLQPTSALSVELSGSGVDTRAGPWADPKP
jgi:hypothetical protein